MGRRAAAILASAACALASVLPATAGCLDGRWPLERESAAIAAASGTAPLANGAHVRLERFQALTLALQPPAEPPGHLTGQSPNRVIEPPTGHEGYILVMVDAPGLYQVTLAEAAWVDVVQRGLFLPAAAFTQAKDCPGVQKSLRFDLKPGAGLLRISRALGPRITFVLSEVDHTGE